MSGRPKIVLLGMMSKIPVAGVAWQNLHYLLGFERLGFDAYYVEAHARTPGMLMRAEGDDASALASDYIRRTLTGFGLGQRWAYHALHADGRVYGMSERELERLYESAELIVNLHGGTEPRPEHAATGRLVYLETDPVQLKSSSTRTTRTPSSSSSRTSPSSPSARTTARPVASFRSTSASASGRLASPSSSTPGSARERTRALTRRSATGASPGATSASAVAASHGAKTRSSGDSWGCRGGADGRSSSLSRATVPRIASCSKAAGSRFATRSISPRASTAIATTFGRRGRVHRREGAERAPPHRLVQRPERHLPRLRPSGRDPGHRFRRCLPTGQALFPFSTVDEAVEAIARIEADYPRAPGGGRARARCFDAHLVLGRLLDDVGVRIPGRSRGVPASALPATVDLVPVSRRPVLAAQTVESILERPLPDTGGDRLGRRRRDVSVVVPVADGLAFTRASASRASCSRPTMSTSSSSSSTTARRTGRASTSPIWPNETHACALSVTTKTAASLPLSTRDLRQPAATPSSCSTTTRSCRPARSRAWLRISRGDVGLVGATTNRSGNEAEVEPPYRTYGELVEFAAAGPPSTWRRLRPRGSDALLRRAAPQRARERGPSRRTVRGGPLRRRRLLCPDA